ncbi:MAG: methyltransferase domain-containing protein, partial [Phycisphaerae bacterium]
MRESTLRLLVHPETLEPFHVSVTKRDADDVCEGTLHAGRGTQYPILNGIPTFVPAEVASSQTVRSFSDKWSKHKYYREHTRRFYAEWYFSRYGFDGSNGLGQFLEGMDFILDAGTGAGRDAALLADASSATVFGVDSARSALEAARKQVNDARVAFVQADLNGLPFPDEFFDFINCDQVIHHMPEPQATFERLRAKLKPGGWICCYVYRKKAVVREFT